MRCGHNTAVDLVRWLQHQYYLFPNCDYTWEYKRQTLWGNEYAEENVTCTKLCVHANHTNSLMDYARKPTMKSTNSNSYYLFLQIDISYIVIFIFIQCLIYMYIYPSSKYPILYIVLWKYFTDNKSYSKDYGQTQ